MPKLVYGLGLRGIEPQVLHDDSVFGVDQKKQNYVQAFELEPHQAELSLETLTAIFPCSVTVED